MAGSHTPGLWMAGSHTPGPWKWRVNEATKQVVLEGGEIRYDLLVMDFVRYGINRAAPRFNSEIRPHMNIMKRAETFAAVQAGREHHADWHKVIVHPDAALIEQAPAMDIVLRLVAAGLARIERPHGLVEFCFRGVRYPVSAGTDWSGVLDVIGWKIARAALAAKGVGT